MNKQKTFTGMEYAQRKRTGRREKFLDAMDAIILRAAFEEKITPYTNQMITTNPLWDLFLYNNTEHKISQYPT